MAAPDKADAADAPLHGFSIDLEDWFHILQCEGAPAAAGWEALEDRIAVGTRRFLEVLDRHGCKATFFALGWVAARHPELLAEIASRGHEVGSHGHMHRPVTALARDDFARDLDASITAISAATGRTVRAFRAPGFSIGWAQSWAFPILVSRGIELDSSLFLARRALGGIDLERRRPFRVVLPDGRSLLEVPVVPARLGRLAVPYSGGGYLRALPARLLWALFARAEAAGESAILYLHPRELDPQQPRMDLPPLRAFKHYVGLNDVDRKLARLLARHRFGTLSAVAAARPLDPPLELPGD